MPPRRMTYMEIADDLHTRIASEEYPPGSALPPRAELADVYSVSVATVKRALTVLRVRGVVVDVPGIGVFTAE